MHNTMFSFTSLNTKWAEEIMVLNAIDLARDFSNGESVMDLIGKLLCSYESDYSMVSMIIWSHIAGLANYDVETIHFDYGSSKMVLFKFYDATGC